MWDKKPNPQEINLVRLFNVQPNPTEAKAGDLIIVGLDLAKALGKRIWGASG